MIDEYELGDRLKAQLESNRQVIWDQVRVQRARRRVAAATLKERTETLLPGYEEAIRESRPDLVSGLADIERARDRLQVTEEQVLHAVEDLQRARQKDQAAADIRRNQARVQRVEEAIQRAESALANPEKAGKPGSRNRIFRLLRRTKPNQSELDSSQGPAAKVNAELDRKIDDARRSLRDIRTGSAGWI